MAFGRGGGRGGGRGRGRGRGGGQPSGNSTVELAIKGWTNSTIKPADQKSQVLSWLRSKSGGSQIISDRMAGRHVLIIEIWEKDQDRFWQVDGWNWAGTTIKIEESRQRHDNNDTTTNNNQSRGGGNAQNNQRNNSGFGGQYNNNDLFTNEVENKIVSVIRRRHEVGKHLNLNALIMDSELLEIPGIQNAADATKVWEAIFTICKTKVWETNYKRNENVHSVTLSNNKLDSVKYIQSLSRTFPRLRNLDLSSNQLQNIDALSFWKREFRDLEHLILRGNPVNDQSDTLSTLREWYPNLKMFNGAPADGSQPAIANVTALPGPGQVPFRPDPQQQCAVAPVILPVAPSRPQHPEIPADSLFAVYSADKPPDVLIKEQMGLKFSLETRLTLAATEECLKSNGWDYLLAMKDFQEVHLQGRIPADKFIKGL